MSNSERGVYIFSKFICPDGVAFPVDSCLESCRIADKFDAHRCLSHRTLCAISQSNRPWSGTPSVTQLLNGTREEFLKISQDFAIDPQQKIFGIFGTGCHAFLEQFLENDRMVAEKRLLDPTKSYSGQFDCYDGRRQILYDVKTYGSFKTAQALGLVKHKDLVTDDDGNPVKHVNGKKVYRTHFTIGHRSVHDVAIQLNAYRLMLESNGFPVKQMIVEIFTRDAGTFSARDRGIFTNMQLLKINRISDHWIQKYLLHKARLLVDSLKNNQLPPPCRNVECWFGRKCKDFCSVWEFCDKGRSIKC